MNALSWIILALVALALIAVLWSMFRKKKAGNSACGSCSSCPMNGCCKKNNKSGS